MNRKALLISAAALATQLAATNAGAGDRPPVPSDGRTQEWDDKPPIAKPKPEKKKKKKDPNALQSPPADQRGTHMEVEPEAAPVGKRVNAPQRTEGTVPAPEPAPPMRGTMRGESPATVVGRKPNVVGSEPKPLEPEGTKRKQAHRRGTEQNPENEKKTPTPTYGDPPAQ